MTAAESKPYEPGSNDCCCGDPNCNEFEERMARWGIPLDEIVEVTQTYSFKDGEIKRLPRVPLSKPMFPIPSKYVGEATMAADHCPRCNNDNWRGGWQLCAQCEAEYHSDPDVIEQTDENS